MALANFDGKNLKLSTRRCNSKLLRITYGWAVGRLSIFPFRAIPSTPFIFGQDCVHWQTNSFSFEEYEFGSKNGTFPFMRKKIERKGDRKSGTIEPSLYCLSERCVFSVVILIFKICRSCDSSHAQKQEHRAQWKLSPEKNHPSEVTDDDRKKDCSWYFVLRF